MSRIAAHWLTLALAASAAMLATAHAFETFGGLAPCTLCLRQREVYWTAMGVAAAGLIVVRLRPRLRGLACAALTTVFLFGMGVAIYHAGAEQHWWPGPSTCSGGGSGVSAADMNAILKGERIEGPACDRIVWSFLGLSMAGWNAVISLALAALSGLAAARVWSRR